MYSCMYQESLKNHNKFLVCLHLANKANYDSDSEKNEWKLNVVAIENNHLLF